jgi:DNA-binding NarL/FixJ family response regulator
MGHDLVGARARHPSDGMGTGVIRVAVIEDHPVFRHGLAGAVEQTPEMELCVSAASIEQYGQLATPTPDVVLLDLHLPGRQGADGVSYVVGLGSSVLVVSAAATRGDVVDAIAAGARGYLSKQAEATEILTAVRVVAEGGTYVSPTLASYLLDAARSTGPTELELTAREREVLGLLAAGERDQDIADALFISVRTVRSHLDRIRGKTGRRRRSELTRLALECGIAPPGEPSSRNRQ